MKREGKVERKESESKKMTDKDMKEANLLLQLYCF